MGLGREVENKRESGACSAEGSACSRPGLRTARARPGPVGLGEGFPLVSEGARDGDLYGLVFGFLRDGAQPCARAGGVREPGPPGVRVGSRRVACSAGPEGCPARCAEAGAAPERKGSAVPSPWTGSLAAWRSVHPGPAEPLPPARAGGPGGAHACSSPGSSPGPAGHRDGAGWCHTRGLDRAAVCGVRTAARVSGRFPDPGLLGMRRGAWAGRVAPREPPGWLTGDQGS